MPLLSALEFQSQAPAFYGTFLNKMDSPDKADKSEKGLDQVKESKDADYVKMVYS